MVACDFGPVVDALEHERAIEAWHGTLDAELIIYERVVNNDVRQTTVDFRSGVDSRDANLIVSRQVRVVLIFIQMELGISDTRFAQQRCTERVGVID